VTLWAVEGNAIKVTDGVHAFYNKKQECEGEDLAVDISNCANYTQLVWSTTRQIGCAVHRCEPLVGQGWNGMYLVCNCWKLGGRKPFIKGPACTNSSNGAGWCHDGLCDRP